LTNSNLKKTKYSPTYSNTVTSRRRALFKKGPPPLPPPLPRPLGTHPSAQAPRRVVSPTREKPAVHCDHTDARKDRVMRAQHGALDQLACAVGRSCASGAILRNRVPTSSRVFKCYVHALRRCVVTSRRGQQCVRRCHCGWHRLAQIGVDWARAAEPGAG